ncbi:MAG: SDR family oxidoreductase [Steroidobacteraceae bacterium]
MGETTASGVQELVKGRKQAFIVGCGYVGRRLAQQLGKQYNLYGLVRSTDHLKALRAVHVEPIVVNLDKLSRQDLSPVWFRNCTLFYFAPPPGEGESDTRLNRFLNLLEAYPDTLIYISTTGVYGNTQGATVDETTQVNPQTQRASRRVSAEHITRIWCTENKVRRVVLRVPAIYGPGRLPLDRLRKGEPVIRPEEAPIINRIHVDDLVQACMAATLDPETHGIYNVSDGNSISLTEYLQRVAHLAKLPEPPQIPMDEAQLSFSPEYLSYLDESRRIDNTRMRNELGVQLRYADLSQGILASLQEQSDYAARRFKP